jgi:hypothetical protein
MVIDGCTAWWIAKPGTIKVEDETIYARLMSPGHGKCFYDPLEVPALPNLLAKVTNRDSAIEFVDRFGLLGYSGLKSATNQSVHDFGVPIDWFEWLKLAWKGDPLSWFLSHASTVDLVLRLIVHLSTGNEDGISQLLRSRMVYADGMVEGDKTERVAGLVLAQGSEVRFRPISLDGAVSGQHSAMAAELIVNLVNSNTQFVRNRLQLSFDKDDIWSSISFVALIEAVWYLVGQAAAKARFSGIRLCEECGAPFIVTDKRQRFCPGGVGYSSSSTCGTRSRKRRQRQAAKEGRS